VTKDPRVYLAHILERANRIEEYVRDGQARYQPHGERGIPAESADLRTIGGKTEWPATSEGAGSDQFSDDSGLHHRRMPVSAIVPSLQAGAPRNASRNRADAHAVERLKKHLFPRTPGCFEHAYVTLVWRSGVGCVKHDVTERQIESEAWSRHR
jgi:hypothetical protein